MYKLRVSGETESQETNFNWTYFQVICQSMKSRIRCTNETGKMRTISLTRAQGFFYVVIFLDKPKLRCEYKLRVSVHHEDSPRSFPILFDVFFNSENVAQFKVSSDISSREFRQARADDQQRFKDTTQYTIYLVPDPANRGMPNVLQTCALVTEINAALARNGIRFVRFSESDIPIFVPGYVSGRFVPEYEATGTERVSAQMLQTDPALQLALGSRFQEFVERIRQMVYFL